MNHTQSLPAAFLIAATASGKSDLLLKLGHELSDKFEIISVDSAQVYRGLNIGTAKPSFEQQQIVKHHLIDCVDPDQNFTVAMFIQQALQQAQAIHNSGKIPIFAGGSMMYFHALEHGLACMPTIDCTTKQRVEAIIQQGKAWAELNQYDPESAARIHQHDNQRIARALEIYFVSGSPISKLQAQTTKPQMNFTGPKIILSPYEREQAHQRVNTRFDNMLAAGLVTELKTIIANSKHRLSATHSSMRCIGYRQIWQYLHNQCGYAEAVAKAKTATRRYLKQQCTWIKHWKGQHRVINCKQTCFEALRKYILKQHMLLQ